MSDTPDTAADEQRFAPKDIESSKPAPNQEPAPQKDVADDDQVNTEVATQEDTPASTPKKDYFFWYVTIGILTVLVAGLTYLVYIKLSHMPNPAAEMKALITSNQAEINAQQKKLKAIQAAALPKENLLKVITLLRDTSEDIITTQKDIKKAEDKVNGVRGAIRAYDKKYRTTMRKKAKGRTFDTLVTIHTQKTYYNVEISNVENNRISIVHDNGATTISANDLPDNIRELCAYGDPLNIEAMNHTDTTLTTVAPRSRTTSPKPAPTAPKKPRVVVEVEPPAGSPRVSSPTHTEGDAPAADNWVPPVHTPLPDVQ